MLDVHGKKKQRARCMLDVHGDKELPVKMSREQVLAC
jgi:hypothetical protein